MLALALMVLAAAPEPLVEVQALVPDAVVDLRYATEQNFMKKAVYPKGARCLLLERAAKTLVKATDALRAKGFRVVLYDCYRPAHVQQALWDAKPVRGYVADPKRGGSHHSRGCAVDLSLLKLDGGVVEMPSEFDAFGKAAHQWYEGGTASSRANRDLLRDAMERAGFARNPMEWWHFDLPDSIHSPSRDDSFEGPATPAPAPAVTRP